MSSTIDIGKGLITKILETKDFVSVKEQQVKPSFLYGKDKRAFQYLNDYYISKGEVPTVRVFKREFPDYELETKYDPDLNSEVIGTDEPLKFWCDEVRRRTKHNKLAENTENIIKSLEDFDTDKAYDIMKKTVLYIEGEVVESQAIDITKNTEDRKLIYLKRKENKGMLGIPTGFDGLDRLVKGWQDKTLVTMISSTGVGKTFFQVLSGAEAQLQGYRVLHLVTEMSEEQMRDRYDAYLTSRVMGIPIDYEMFKDGNLSIEEQDAYFTFLDKKAGKLEPLVIDTATGVSNVAAKIDQYNPDLVFIDSAYLMEDDRGAEQDWLRVAHITRDLKNLAKLRKKPIVINSQADSTTSKKTGPELENIGYSSAIGQDSDVVLALFRDLQMIEDGEMKIKVLKQREGKLGSIMNNWNFKTMDFSPIYFNTSDSNANDTSKGIIEL